MKIFKFILEYIWQLPLMLLALVWLLINKSLGTIEYSFVQDSYTAYVLNRKDSVTLGDMIFLSNRPDKTPLYLILLHEKGHTILSKILGPLYLIVIGLPSLLWAATHKRLFPLKSYWWFYTESWANKLVELLL